MKLENVQKYVYKLLTDTLSLESNYFDTHSENQTFDEIGCDLLSLFDIIESVESKYNIMIDDSVIDDNTTINDLRKKKYKFGF